LNKAAPPTGAVAADAALFALGRALKQSGYRHVAVTPATHQRVAKRDALWRPLSLADVFGWSRPIVDGDLAPRLADLMRAAGVLEPQGSGWRCSVRASTLDGQLYFHSAYPTSAEDAVFFGPDTYRFLRALGPELETNDVTRAIDIGCGAGPAAVAIALRWPQAEVLAADINHDALRMAAVNAALAGAGNVTPLFSNLLDGVDGMFDLIVSNPPYLLDPCKRAYRNGGGHLGLGLSERIVAAALERLAPNGRLLLYTGVAMVAGADPFLARIAPVLDRARVEWDYEEIDPDVFGEELDEAEYRSAERIAAVWLRVTKRAD
jgi:methylase of polypeptide subunit release factors